MIICKESVVVVVVVPNMSMFDDLQYELLLGPLMMVEGPKGSPLGVGEIEMFI